jgi:2-polyprenyl-3-methyl-5-hydroxy-6-metoxy-1,4-benzoquinol methylase
MPKRQQGTPPVSALFRQVAQQGWDQSGHFTYTYKYPLLRRWLIAQLLPKRTILSIGCGRGELEAELAEQRHRVVSLDAFFPMLQVAACNNLTRLVQADAHHLPFRPASFDVVLLPESLGYIEPTRTFEEAARVIKQNGRLILSTYPRHLVAHTAYKKRSFSTIARVLFDAGFVLEDGRFFHAKRAVKEVPTEDRCTVFFMVARKKSAP